jgi:hypothetical protein
MSDERSTSRTVFVLSRGARGCLLLGALMLVFGAYLLVSPIDIQSREGPMFACGSGLQPPTEAFQKNVCGRLSQQRQTEAAFLGVGAIVIAVGGLLVFGSSRREERVYETAPEAAEPQLHRP